jgi:hypothetical protein
VDIGAVVYQRLASDAAVAAIVGTRIAAIEASDKDVLPLIVYAPTIEGDSDGTAPVRSCTVEVHCWAKDDSVAQQLADAVTASLQGYSGHRAGTWVHHLSLRTQRDDRNFEYNEWGRLLTFEGMAAFG